MSIDGETAEILEIDGHRLEVPLENVEGILGSVFWAIIFTASTVLVAWFVFFDPRQVFVGTEHIYCLVMVKVLILTSVISFVTLSATMIYAYWIKPWLLGSRKYVFFATMMLRSGISSFMATIFSVLLLFM
ncbi:MAG: hypothetical protein AUJ28_01875 [Parcubacteria group bacterium CG1_02_37_51]|uniref:Uncharacterized protein n=2 Tax=Candidatus Komeiliibacteriota TaxID=1817908 RepID=A0A2M8DS45_9BACT|nr:MAG: hypothetical protein AUJ28_01875 [Parcubacteria group bacterium CG1_02_37_51]PIY94219.1 MAG: hypothetical protein COY67_03070 [Candidatus Komeilibacteria bacterium CG_4_10_14_0_8_um_filter_37_78]PJC02158.1 MAG: hypothetical protein CO073_00910 [Candidatus Komeilibacteria bacterium CG_4_9_14_0_8_um_filter_36_9]